MKKREMIQTPEFRALMCEFINTTVEPNFRPELKRYLDTFIKEILADRWIIEEFSLSDGTKAVRQGEPFNIYVIVGVDGIKSSVGSTLSSMLGAVNRGWAITKATDVRSKTTVAIGDTVKCKNALSHLAREQKVEGFSINKEDSIVVHTNLTNDNGLHLSNVEVIVKKNTVLCADGVEVDAEDKVYFVTGLSISRRTARLAVAIKGLVGRSNDKFYSTLELAKEAAVRQNPVFSIDDLAKIATMDDTSRKMFIEIACKKLTLPSVA